MRVRQTAGPGGLALPTESAMGRTAPGRGDARHLCFFEIGDGKGTLLRFDYDYPPKPPTPNRLWHLGKVVFNKTYWHTVPKGRV
jgi:hypothetical protein